MFALIFAEQRGHPALHANPFQSDRHPFRVIALRHDTINPTHCFLEYRIDLDSVAHSMEISGSSRRLERVSVNLSDGVTSA